MPVNLRVKTKRKLLGGEPDYYVNATDVMRWMHDQAEKAMKTNNLTAVKVFMYVFDEMSAATNV